MKRIGERIGLVLGFVVFVALGFGVVLPNVEAANLYVPSGYSTIQAAVNAAGSGDTITVSAGTYTEAVYISKGIALVGVGTPVIKPPSYTNAVKFGSGADNASISGFKITGASSGYCGIYCYSSSPSITNNIISGNSGYGIYCYYSSSPTITNNTISGNSGSGISCYYYSSPTITNNTISGNSGSGIYRSSSYYSSPTISYNDVWNNTSSNYYSCSGTNEISADPKFIGAGDYHLQFSSPCVDTGLNTALGIPSTDKDGNPRIMNGRVNMGAYEFSTYITGIISYSGTKTGTLYYSAFTNPQFTGTPTAEWT
ncbi:right-handed parallel beta-helix repeat-containing protein [bacterium]|nr:right-handed parallel beta-helix repeat-containing protein [bacterium]MBU1752824.1 right-handed parallel beta-helix repeat-containing protein [bacterium]